MNVTFEWIAGILVSLNVVLVGWGAKTVFKKIGTLEELREKDTERMNAIESNYKQEFKEVRSDISEVTVAMGKMEQRLMEKLHAIHLRCATNSHMTPQEIRDLPSPPAVDGLQG